MSFSNVELHNKLFKEFKSVGVNIKRMHKSDLDLIISIINKQSTPIFIHDFANLVPYYINDFGKQYYGFKHNEFDVLGFEAYVQIAHPEDFDSVHQIISFFGENPKGTHRTIVRVKHNSGEYRHLYALDRAINFTKEGKPKYLLSISFDIESGIQRSFNHLYNKSNIQEKQSLYNSLSERERDIVKRVGQEMTSKEIADELFIQVSTVDTHRKRIIKKLGVKSSLGLVKFAVLFSDMKL